jgi:glucose/arabinose dehydrogenase
MNRLYSFMAICIVAVPLYSQHMSIRNAFPDLSFTRAVDLQHAGDGTDRIFVLTQPGVIYVFDNDASVSEAEVFLDLTGNVNVGFEMGLLGLAFHPDYENNGYFYINYNPTSSLTRVSRFEVSESDPNRADEESELVLLEFNQPAFNHNGGQLAFGPDDGYLYISSGDGGPSANAQNRTNLLGNILRIDVDNTDEGLNYAIPDDNPFVDITDGTRKEIFAYGFRNPWRMSFDPETGWLWVGDVGQSNWEIIHVVESGKNYGWDIVEGSHCYPPNTSCDTEGLEMPVFEYAWLGQGSAITGGYVYRGPTISELTGTYIYADYSFGTIWGLEYDGESEPVNEELFNAPFSIGAFGVDEANELYILEYSFQQGSIYVFDAVTAARDRETMPEEFSLDQNYPNPFNNSTVIRFSVPEAENVRIEVYNLLGQKIDTLTDRVYERGEYHVSWNAEGMSSGVYLYRMRAGEYMDTRRMVLMQ